MPLRNAPPVASGLAVLAFLAAVAAPGRATAQEAAPTSHPDCLYFVPATTWSPPDCVRERPEPGPLDGLNTVGYVGAGMTMAGMTGTIMGIGLVLEGSNGKTDETLMTGGGVTAGVGLLLLAVGAPMWVLGKDDEHATKVGVGAGSVHVGGTF